MIIGISGKKNSGKDTVGIITQGLNMSLDLDMIHYNATQGIEYEKGSGWEIKKFADKLKDIVCMLIGCTREQLEDREFKNTPLGMQWDRTVWHVQSNHNKCETFSSKEDAKEGLSHWEENYHQEVYIASEDITMTPRLMLQLLGTECGRNIIHPEIWINSLFTDCNPTHTDHVPGGFEYPNWLITDVRFPNEAEAIKRRNGLLIRVESKRCDYTDRHPSEIALDNYGGEGNEVRTDRWDKVIFNDGTIVDLIKEVKLFLINKKLI